MRFPSKRAMTDDYCSSILSESSNNKSRVIPCIPCHGWNSYLTSSIWVGTITKSVTVSTKYYPAT